jgi:hypothetical protein
VNNTILTLVQWRAATGRDQHSIIATPKQLFVDSTTANYRLSATSPARDAGTSAGACLYFFDLLVAVFPSAVSNSTLTESSLASPAVACESAWIIVLRKDRINLKLIRTKIFGSGSIVLYYEPAKKNMAVGLHLE